MGTAAYLTRIIVGGTSTAFVDEPTTSLGIESGTGYFVYQITDAGKRVLDRGVSATVKDGVSPISADNIGYIDYLFGRVALIADVTGPVTVSGNYIPVSDTERVNSCNSHTLNQSLVVHNAENYKDTQDNGGHRTRKTGIKDASVSLGGFFEMSADVKDAFDARTPVLVQIQPGGGPDIFRGWFLAESMNYSGGMDDLEGLEVSFQLDDSAAATGDHVNMRWN